MKAKVYLEQIIYLDSKIREELENVRRIKDRATTTTANLTPDKVQTSGSKDKIGDAVSLYATIEARIKGYEAEKQAIVDTINLLSYAERIVIYNNYVLRKTLKEIAADLDKSLSWAQKKSSDGIRHLQRILDKREKGRA